MSEYNDAISDVARASTQVLWIDPTSNYAVYSAAGVNVFLTDRFSGRVEQSVRHVCMSVCIDLIDCVKVLRST